MYYIPDVTTESLHLDILERLCNDRTMFPGRGPLLPGQITRRIGAPPTTSATAVPLLAIVANLTSCSRENANPINNISTSICSNYVPLLMLCLNKFGFSLRSAVKAASMTLTESNARAEMAEMESEPEAAGYLLRSKCFQRRKNCLANGALGLIIRNPGENKVL